MNKGRNMKNEDKILWSFKCVDPVIHKRYRNAYWSNKGTLRGIYAELLPKDLCFLNEVLYGRVKLEGDWNLENYRHTPRAHSLEHCSSKVTVLMKGQKNDFTRLNVRNVPLNVFKSLKKYLVNAYGSFYGYSGFLVSMAMDLRLKMRLGEVKVLKNSRKYAKHVLSGETISPLHSEVITLKRELEEITKAFKEFWKFLPKNKSCNNVIKQFKSVSKLDKAVEVLDALKKFNETHFSHDEYGNVLLRLFGQADKRTIKSDLEALKNAEFIIPDLSNRFFGKTRFKFVENKLYGIYNSPKAMRRVVRAFKRKFRDCAHVSKSEILAFIKHISGLNDNKSVLERLNTLLLGGYLSPVSASNEIFKTHLN